MKLIIDSVALSAESILLAITLLFFTYSTLLVNTPTPDYVHQFHTFQELTEATITCPLIYNDGGGSSNASESLPRCPIDEDRLNNFNDYELNAWLNYRHILPGGRFKPIGCEPIQRVAIVVPYRDRQEQLEKFSLYIHQFLPDQLIEYTLYVIEQTDDKPFNRAKLLNVGVAEVSKLDKNVCCFIFHDVDLLPLNKRNLYMCSTRPRHMSVSVSTLRFRLLYPSMFGGVTSLTKEQFETVGGFSNEFFGWGGEDDDMFKRVRAAGYEVERSPEQYGVYTMLRHPKMEPNPDRFGNRYFRLFCSRP